MAIKHVVFVILVAREDFEAVSDFSIEFELAFESFYRLISTNVDLPNIREISCLLRNCVDVCGNRNTSAETAHCSLTFPHLNSTWVWMANVTGGRIRVGVNTISKVLCAGLAFLSPYSSKLPDQSLARIRTYHDGGF
jgi:hypothetical protein